MRINHQLKHFLTGFGMLGLAAWCSAAAAADYELLHVGPNDSSAYLGIRQGLEEANRQGEFLGIQFSLNTVAAADFNPALAQNAVAVFVDADTDTVHKITESITGVAVLNLTSSDNGLRLACFDNGLHILPSDQMMTDALAQWRRKNPDSRAHAQAWHPDFVKYAARDLNKRFKAGQGTEMDDPAWAGWAAVKLVTDTIVRQGVTDQAKLLDYLQNDLIFDGQKGVDMHFRINGQLRQIVLLVENGEIVGEAPVRGVADPTDLDSIGITGCSK